MKWFNQWFSGGWFSSPWFDAEGQPGDVLSITIGVSDIQLSGTVVNPAQNITGSIDVEFASEIELSGTVDNPTSPIPKINTIGSRSHFVDVRNRLAFPVREASGSASAVCFGKTFAHGSDGTESLWQEIEDEEFVGVLMMG